MGTGVGMTTRPDHGKQAATGRYWPDRKAHVHRKRAHQVFYVLAILVAVTPWFGYRYVRDVIRGDDPTPSALQDVASAAAPLGGIDTAMPVHGGSDSASAARHMGAIRAAAAAGNDEAMRAGVDAMNTASRQAMRLVDPGRAVDREAARAAVQQLPGVRAAGWIDRTRLLVMTAGGDASAEAMTETVCRRLEPLGDTVGVVVSVQDAATSGLPRETSRSCHSTHGEQVEPQPPSASASTSTPSTPPQTDGAGVAGALPAHGEARLAPVEADPKPIEQPEANDARNEESMRILEETTPEM
jgi:hypothetical protein